MANVVFYEKPGCKGNARQKAVLAAAGHSVQARSLKAGEIVPAGHGKCGGHADGNGAGEGEHGRCGGH